MFEHFALRHIPPLIHATIWAVGGLMSLTHGPEQALLAFGFSPAIASAKAAWPLVQIEGARITTMGLALWGMYLGGHLEAMDTLLSCIGWMTIVDGYICSQVGAPGSVKMHVTYKSIVAAWGLLGMTSAKYF